MSVGLYLADWWQCLAMKDSSGEQPGPAPLHSIIDLSLLLRIPLRTEWSHSPWPTIVAWQFDMQERRFTSFCLLALYTGKAQASVTSQLILQYIHTHHALLLTHNFVLYVEMCSVTHEYTYVMCTGVRHTHTHTHTTVTVVLLPITIMFKDQYHSTVHEMWGRNVSTRNRSSSGSLY